MEGHSLQKVEGSAGTTPMGSAKQLGMKNLVRNRAGEEVVLVEPNDLERNSIISRTTRGRNFRRAKNRQVQIFNQQSQQVEYRDGLPKPKELEEEEYFDQLEKIIQRDFFPRDDVEDLEDSNQQEKKVRVDEFLRRNTSEDNIAFHDLVEKDRQKFMRRISWMFDSSARYERLNQLAITARDTGMLVSSASNDRGVSNQNSRTVPALAFAPASEARSSLFFGAGLGNSGIDQVKHLQGDEKKIEPENTRFQKQFLEKQDRDRKKKVEEYFKQSEQDFKVPMPPSYKVQGIKAKEALGLYLAESSFRKKREEKYLQKQQPVKQLNPNTLPESMKNKLEQQSSISKPSGGRTRPPVISSATSVVSFKTEKQSQISMMSKLSRASHMSSISQKSMRQKIGEMSKAGQALLMKCVNKKGL